MRHLHFEIQWLRKGLYLKNKPLISAFTEGIVYTSEEINETTLTSHDGKQNYHVTRVIYGGATTTARQTLHHKFCGSAASREPVALQVDQGRLALFSKQMEEVLDFFWKWPTGWIARLWCWEKNMVEKHAYRRDFYTTSFLIRRIKMWARSSAVVCSWCMLVTTAFVLGLSWLLTSQLLIHVC